MGGHHGGEAHTSDDLNWREEASRSVQEHNDSTLRPAISGKNLEEFAPDALWQDGERFTGRSTQDDAAEWLETLDLNVRKEGSL